MVVIRPLGWVRERNALHSGTGLPPHGSVVYSNGTRFGKWYAKCKIAKLLAPVRPLWANQLSCCRIFLVFFWTEVCVSCLGVACLAPINKTSRGDWS